MRPRLQEWEDFSSGSDPSDSSAAVPAGVRYQGTAKSNVLRIRMDPDVKKQDIRLLKPGVLEVEWPRSAGEEIPVE